MGKQKKKEVKQNNDSQNSIESNDSMPSMWPPDYYFPNPWKQGCIMKGYNNFGNGIRPGLTAGPLDPNLPMPKQKPATGDSKKEDETKQSTEYSITQSFAQKDKENSDAKYWVNKKKFGQKTKLEKGNWAGAISINAATDDQQKHSGSVAAKIHRNFQGQQAEAPGYTNYQTENQQFTFNQEKSGFYAETSYSMEKGKYPEYGLELGAEQIIDKEKPSNHAIKLNQQYLLNHQYQQNPKNTLGMGFRYYPESVFNIPLSKGNGAFLDASATFQNGAAPEWMAKGGFNFALPFDRNKAENPWVNIGPYLGVNNQAGQTNLETGVKLGINLNSKKNKKGK